MGEKRSSKLRDLVEERLSETRIPADEALSRKFILPVLKCKSDVKHFTIPELQSEENKVNNENEPTISQTQTRLTNNEVVAEPLIDLSKALNSRTNRVKSACSHEQQESQCTNNAMEIPNWFNCVENEDSTKGNFVEMPCQLDVSKKSYQHLLSEPSPFGRMLCHMQEIKSSRCIFERINMHSTIKPTEVTRVKPFAFDTPSPDDLRRERLVKQ